MRAAVERSILVASLTLGMSLAACERSAPQQVSQQKAASEPSRTATELPSLRVAELLAPGTELKPSESTAALSGKRLRLVGFVAEMELPPRGALYLVPRPVKCDEAGGGTADLPPDAVLVTLPETLKEPPEHVPGLVEAVGVFEVGNRSDTQGRVTNFRLRLEAPNVHPTSSGLLGAK